VTVDPLVYLLGTVEIGALESDEHREVLDVSSEESRVRL
jgi:hypothetical protein